MEVRRSVDGWTVRLSGEFGFDVADLQREFDAVIADRPKIVRLDLGGLTMISSLLLGALVALRRAIVRNGGEIRTVAAAPVVRDVFRRVSLATLFGMDDATPSTAPGETK